MLQSTRRQLMPWQQLGFSSFYTPGAFLCFQPVIFGFNRQGHQSYRHPTTRNRGEATGSRPEQDTKEGGRSMAWANGNSRTSTTHWKRLRNQARRELPSYCANCGTQGRLELDHIRPHSAGGTDSLDNVQWLCTACHQEKSQGEAAAARRARRQRLQLPRRPHPGLV